MNEKYGPRTRTTNDYSNNGLITIKTRPYPGGTWSSSDETQGVVSKNLDVMSDVVVQDFHKRIEAGEVINNSMLKTIHTISSGSGNYHATPTGVGTEVDWTGQSITRKEMARIPGSFPDHTLNKSFHIAVARQTALANMDSTPYNFLEDQFELHKTISFLKNPFQDAAELARKIDYKRQSNLAHGMTATKALAKAWLTYRYALRPLMFTIRNALYEWQDKQLERATGLRGSHTLVRRTARGKSEDKIDVIDFTNGGLYNVYSRRQQLSYSARAGILYETTNPIESFSKENGLTLKELPKTLYNLMPYSWALDHFINVNQFIGAMTNLADPKLTILAAWTTTHDISTVTDKWESRTVPGFTITLNADQYKEVIDVKSRTPWYPVFYDTLPSYNAKFYTDVKFLGDLSALVVKRLLGKF